MPKNIVICCDGTNNKFGAANTNVVKLFSLAQQDPEKQVVFYDPGVGTFSDTAALTPAAKKTTRMMGLAFGYGISRNLANAYDFMSDHWRPDDKIYMFGFSRGSYAVRSLAALVFACGLLRRQHRNLTSYTIELFKSEYLDARKVAEAEKKRTGNDVPLQFPLCHAFRDTFSSRPQIHFLGVWDTVVSVGTIHNPLNLPYTRWNPIVQRVRQAMAIDERRKFFRQNLWSSTQTADIKQVWFAGDHSDVGGGYAEKESGLSKITLDWMLEEAKTADFLVDPIRLPRVLRPPGTDPALAAADPTAQMHNELDKWGWKLAQWVPRQVWTHGKTVLRFSPGELPRYIAPGSRVHHSVFERMQRTQYRPPNLPENVTDENGNPVNWKAMIARPAMPQA